MKNKSESPGREVGFLVVKLMSGVGGRERVPETLSRDAAIEWATAMLKTRFRDHSAWLFLSETDKVFLRGIN